MTTPLLKRGRRLATRALQLALAAAFLFPAGVVRADEPTGVVHGTPGTPARTTYSAETFQQLERLDDPALEPQKAGHRRHERHHHYHERRFSGAEIVLLIILFPLGLIVLIIVLADDD
jgi:hypothetical protein